MWIKQQNNEKNLSGFLNTNILSEYQKIWLRQYASALKSIDNKPDGTVLFDNRLIINYSEPDNFIHSTVLQSKPVGDRIYERYVVEGNYTDSYGGQLRIVRDKKTNYQYLDMGNIAPVLVRILSYVEPPKSETPPITDIPMDLQDPNCPCDCQKQTIVEKVYLSPVQIKSDDTPVKLKTNKRICKSKDNQTKYMFDCNTSISEINRQLNLNGLADCPCDCTDQVIEQTYYITNTPCQNCIPFDVAAEKIICNDTDQITGRRVDCNDLKESLRQRGYTGLADRFDCMVSDDRLYGIDNSESFIKANDYLVPKMALGLIAGSLIIKLIRN